MRGTPTDFVPDADGLDMRSREQAYNGATCGCQLLALEEAESMGCHRRARHVRWRRRSRPLPISQDAPCSRHQVRKARRGAL